MSNMLHMQNTMVPQRPLYTELSKARSASWWCRPMSDEKQDSHKRSHELPSLKSFATSAIESTASLKFSVTARRPFAALCMMCSRPGTANEASNKKPQIMLIFLYVVQHLVDPMLDLGPQRPRKQLCIRRPHIP